MTSRNWRGVGALILIVSVLCGATELSACPTTEKLIEHLVSAHGGMDAWASAPTVSFTDEFVPAGVPQGISSRVTVEQGARRAYIDYEGGMTATWDGEKAWSQNWALPYPPRFMALLNYHFLNLPWLVEDPGVILSEFGQRQLPGDETEYFSIKVTYDENVGDTPRDYYRLYVDPDSHVLHAVQYIVTYQALLPEGMTETPANTLVYEDFETVSGLRVPTAYRIYLPDGSEFGAATIRDWSFDEPFDTARMTMPDDAVLDESTP